VNETLRTFGYPLSALREYEHWVVLLRPGQITLGSLVVCTTGAQTRMSDMPAAAFTELEHVFRGAETALRTALNPDKINHLMLMMVDPHVHWHVVPRYGEPRTVGTSTIPDAGWPGFSGLQGTELPESDRIELRNMMLRSWPDEL
jgi:diadenosine tetraphosphate (Ap4A) HIT family hydrolase